MSKQASLSLSSIGRLQGRILNFGKVRHGYEKAIEIEQIPGGSAMQEYHIRHSLWSQLSSQGAHLSQRFEAREHIGKR